MAHLRGTGTDAGLKGGGTPNTTVESFGNVCAGAIDVRARRRSNDVWAMLFVSNPASVSAMPADDA